MIDRYRVITRHNPVYGSKIEKDAPLSLGNGAFCFTADFTGLQTFFGEYAAGEDAFPLCTLAEWGWHSYADAPADDSSLRLTNFDTAGRRTAYAVDETGQEELFRGLRQNAHKFHLGTIGLELADRPGAGSGLMSAAIKPVKQELNLWEGVLYSEFTVKGIPVKTETLVHPHSDTVYTRASSPLFETGEPRIVLRFPYGSHKKAAADFTVPALHRTEVAAQTAAGLVLLRVMDGVAYRVAVSFTGLLFDGANTAEHTIAFRSRAASVELAVCFEPLRIPAMGIDRAVTQDEFDDAQGGGGLPLRPGQGPGLPPLRDARGCARTGERVLASLHLGVGPDKRAHWDKCNRAPVHPRNAPNSAPFVQTGGPAAAQTPFAEARQVCLAFWENFWNTGGAVDFAGSSDSRAFELERRIVLSRYLTAIQSRGKLPPAETGLTCNSWYGKFHLEMIYWHSAHFALWGKREALEKILDWYKQILPTARKIAASQGYRGARWPKMCDPTGYNTPSSIAVLLIWQQPHPVMLALLCRRAGAGKDFLRKYRDLVFESAVFMLDFIREREGGLVVGPPYIPAQERHDPLTTLNAAYELEYFRWALEQADILLGELGETPGFTAAAERLALPAQKDGVYLAHENCPGTFTTPPFYTDHPSMLAMYGVLNSGKIDRGIMSATLDKALSVWDRDSLWGWDFPMMAMTACRLGRLDDAVDLLLMDSPKNTYLPNGHNKQTGAAALPLYLPGNGGLLLASAMMAAGFDAKPGPLFPAGFNVQSEGLYAYI